MSSDIEHFWNDYLPIRPQDAEKKSTFTQPNKRKMTFLKLTIRRTNAETFMYLELLIMKIIHGKLADYTDKNST